MDLGFATGRGPDLLTNLEGLRPLVRDEDVVVFGFRDAQEQREYGSQPLPPAALALELSEVQRLGAKLAAQRAVEHLTAADKPTQGFFIHLDADVVSDALMPAVDIERRRAELDEHIMVLQTALVWARCRHRGHDLQPGTRCRRFKWPRAGAHADQGFAGLAASDSRKLRASRATCSGGIRARAARSP